MIFDDDAFQLRILLIYQEEFEARYSKRYRIQKFHSNEYCNEATREAFVKFLLEHSNKLLTGTIEKALEIL